MIHFAMDPGQWVAKRGHCDGWEKMLVRELKIIF